jgi:hypothetical protein
VPGRFRIGDRVRLRPEVAIGRFWPYRGVVGIVIETVEVPGSRHLVSVIFTPKYLKNLEDQDEALFEMVARGDP